MDIFITKKIHCIGIGGIGVSALASLWRAQGKAVSGSDAEESEITRDLVDQGIEVIYGGSASEPPEAEPPDIVVYSDAVPEDHPERTEARRRGIPELSYAQALGQVSREYQTIVVTGTHGKSTTTALLGLMLEAAGMDPLVIVGSKVPEWGNSNLRIPNSQFPIPNEISNRKKWFVVEGDDYRDHFLELQPQAVVVTNIEWDHPDYFRDLAHTVESFRKLVEKVPKGGFVVVNEDDGGCRQLISHSAILQNRRMIQYGRGSEIFGTLMLNVPGEFNRYNATAAATCAMELGVPRVIVEKVAHEFRGVWRRFEIVGQLHATCYTLHAPIVISDYGHHPTAIRATMKAAREAYPGRRLILVYQPHQHSRTKHLFNDFVAVLNDAADLVIVSEIYAVKGRMEDHNVSAHMLADKITNYQLPITKVLYGGDLQETKRVVLANVHAGDVVIFMGAGDIDSIARELGSR